MLTRRLVAMLASFCSSSFSCRACSRAASTNVAVTLLMAVAAPRPLEGKRSTDPGLTGRAHSEAWPPTRPHALPLHPPPPPLSHLSIPLKPPPSMRCSPDPRPNLRESMFHRFRTVQALPARCLQDYFAQLACFMASLRGQARALMKRPTISKTERFDAYW